MKYSEIEITDENFDAEYELLCKKVAGSPVIKIVEGLPTTNNVDFVTSLSGFIKQVHESGCDEFIKTGAYPNKGSDFKQALEIGVIAYEFGNGFMVIDYEGIF